MGGSSSKEDLGPLEVVGHVDLEKFSGMWYECGKYPNPFQAKDGEYGTATYALNDDGTMHAIYVEFVRGRKKTANAKLWAPDKEESTSKLRISFLWPFSMNYWIIQLGDDYGQPIHPLRSRFES
mmetsp:Transcript_21670/g.88392  ORF Transcript_21670/g.88392 Transcript_21670/m.88392 type:complete len:124 (-) Transcript_21670:1857-2228(-)